MDEVARLLTLLALAGGGLTLAGGIVAWSLDEVRRVRATLRAGLAAEPDPMLIARGRGAGIGINQASGKVAVAWDRGAWRLIYRMDELVGVELIVDRRIAARAYRGDPRRGLDALDDPQERVRLRFIFDDPSYPDFELDLWRPEDVGRRGRLSAEAAVREANRWMARMEALMRRAPPRQAAQPIPARPPVRGVPASAAPLPFEDPPFDLDDTDEGLDDGPRTAIN
ncbi:MAG: hypothetical protein U1C74_02565 [Phenylobacterium sp.]|nr:hypothetical protein [Phenylobacterium sp.]